MRTQSERKRRFAPMKKLAFVFTLLFSCCTLAVQAQQPSLGCSDTAILKQSAQIKQHYLNQGFTVYRDAMLGMESRMPYPIVMQLEKGQLYVIVFIGNENSKKLNLDLYDANEQPVEKLNVQRNRDEPNHIIYTLSPEFSGEYMAVVIQKLKERTMCGSFFVLKLDPAKAKNGANIVPFQ